MVSCIVDISPFNHFSTLKESESISIIASSTDLAFAEAGLEECNFFSIFGSHCNGCHAKEAKEIEEKEEESTNLVGSSILILAIESKSFVRCLATSIG